MIASGDKTSNIPNILPSCARAVLLSCCYSTRPAHTRPQPLLLAAILLATGLGRWVAPGWAP